MMHEREGGTVRSGVLRNVMNMYTNSRKIFDYILVLPIAVPSFCPMVCKLGGDIPLAPGVCAALIVHA